MKLSKIFFHVDLLTRKKLHYTIKVDRNIRNNWKSIRRFIELEAKQEVIQTALLWTPKKMLSFIQSDTIETMIRQMYR